MGLPGGGLRTRLAFDQGQQAATQVCCHGTHRAVGHVPLPPAGPLFGDFEAVFLRLAPELWTPGPEHWYRPDGPIAALVAGSKLCQKHLKAIVKACVNCEGTVLSLALSFFLIICPFLAITSYCSFFLCANGDKM